MISVSVTEYLKKRLGPIFRFYRLFFNLIAIITLIPVALLAYSIQTQVIFHWNGYMRIGQVILLGIAVLLFFLGGRHYDARQMLGIKQIREGISNKVITDTGELDTSGVLGITRHPWYLGNYSIYLGTSIGRLSDSCKCDTYILLDCRNLPRRKKTYRGIWRNIPGLSEEGFYAYTVQVVKVEDNKFAWSS
jgi:protein-S-isoprenylcysteine O-methyltransferase Ste14